MRAKDLIELIQKTCESGDDEIYISTAKLSSSTHKLMRGYEADIAITPLDSTDQDENGGWKDIDNEPIKGKPYHIW